MNDGIVPRDESVTLAEIARLCLSCHGGAVNTGQPSPLLQLLAELRRLGILTPEDDLAALADSSIAQPVPAPVVMRLWQMTPTMRYEASGGYLKATHSTAALSSREAMDRYGIKLLIQARITGNQLGVPIPGRRTFRIICRIIKPPWVHWPLVIALSPVLALYAVANALIEQRSERKRRGSSGQDLTAADVVRWFGYAACLSIPAASVAAWLILWAAHVPPHGAAGRWVALVLAVAFGAQNLITVLILGLVTVGGAEEGREPPIRCFFRCTWSLILIFAVVNAPLTLCVAVIHAIA